MNGNTLYESSAIRKQSSSGIKVRDMVRRYDTALKSDSIKPSFCSVGSSKSSYFGLNAVPVPVPEDEFEDLYSETVHPPPESPSRSSSSSQNTVRRSRSPRFQALSDIQSIPLDTQKSFMNLSRSSNPPRPAPREKKPRQSSLIGVEPRHKDDKMDITDASYQSKTTISKTPNGVRIIVDIFFDQNNCLAVQDVVGSRIETDIPPSKILKEFQKRVVEENSQYY